MPLSAFPDWTRHGPLSSDAAADPASPTPLFRRSARGSQRAAADATPLALRCLGAGWADGDVGSLEDAVHPRACLRLPLRVCRGPGPLMADALGDLSAMREARFFGEDAMGTLTGPRDICPETAEAQELSPDAEGVIVSARGSLAGLHDGAGWPGPPSGRRLRLRAMADFWCSGGQVHDGWLLRDTAGALAQTGGPSPEGWARARIRAVGGADLCEAPLSPDTDPDGPYTGRGATSEPADSLADRLRCVMDGDFGVLRRGSAEACTAVLPGDLRALGDREALPFWAGLRSALPSAAFRVEHRNAAQAPGEAPRAAVRWSLYGRHDGHGRFGAATGVYVHVLGMTQAEFGPGGVRREWTVIDDCAVWTQILLATGDV